MDNIVFVPRENLINGIRLMIHVGGNLLNVRHTTSARPGITGYLLGAMQIVIIVMYALELANAVLFLSTLSLRRATILRMVHLMELLKLHCKRCFLYLSSFALVSLCCVGFCLGAKADSPTKWTATWNLSNHQSVNYTLNPGASFFRGWTLNINGPIQKGQVYYIKNSPALLSNNQNAGTSYSINEVWANFSGFYWWVEGDNFSITPTRIVTGCVYMCPIISTTTLIKYGVVIMHHQVIL